MSTVALPPRQNPVQAPVWPIEHAVPGISTPLLSKCCRHSRAGGVCCRELNKQQRTLIDPDVVRDVYVKQYILLLYQNS
jgi:hypothetical protein